MAGTSWVARRFPVRLGRAASSDLRLEEEGVWEQHLDLELDREGFSLRIHPNALVRVNGQPSDGTRLRNGDILELGVVRLQFWIGEVRQSRLRFGEAMCWGIITAVFLAQLAVLYWLVR